MDQRNLLTTIGPVANQLYFPHGMYLHMAVSLGLAIGTEVFTNVSINP